MHIYPGKNWGVFVSIVRRSHSAGALVEPCTAFLENSHWLCISSSAVFGELRELLFGAMSRRWLPKKSTTLNGCFRLQLSKLQISANDRSWSAAAVQKDHILPHHYIWLVCTCRSRNSSMTLSGDLDHNMREVGRSVR